MDAPVPRQATRCATALVKTPLRKGRRDDTHSGLERILDGPSRGLHAATPTAPCFYPGLFRGNPNGSTRSAVGVGVLGAISAALGRPLTVAALGAWRQALRGLDIHRVSALGALVGAG